MKRAPTRAGLLVPRGRWLELFLGILAAGIAFAAYTPLVLARRGSIAVPDLLPPAIVVGVGLLVHLGLVLRGRGEDETLVPLVVALLGLGLAFSNRLAPALAPRQGTWIVLGGLAILVITQLPDNSLLVLQRYRYSWAAIGIALVGLTFLAGRSATPGGPRLWLGSSTLGFQPAEVLKLLLVFFLAGYLSEHRELLSEVSVRWAGLRLPPLPYMAPMLTMLGIALTLLIAQRDLGAAMLLFTIALVMLYLASGRLDYVLGGWLAFVLAAYLVHDRIAVLATRIQVWRDPWSDPQGSGYQILQAAMAMAAGGVMGAGISQGSPTDIPAVHTDFVYAALVEELGLAGSAAVLALFVLLTMRGLRIAAMLTSPFYRLLACGLSLSLAIQTIVIVGGIVRLIPLTGITLPFLAHGGTSLLVCCTTVGLLVRLSGRSP